jgi:hypothetical protein
MVPIVNSVCLPLPFFLPLPADAALSESPETRASSGPELEPLPGVQGLATGAGSPKMFRRLWLPLACGLARGPLLLFGSVGKADAVSTGCLALFLPAAAVDEPGPGTEYGTRGIDDEEGAGAWFALDADHAVLDVPAGCPRPGTTCEGPAGFKVGKRSGSRVWGGKAPGT